MTKILPKNYEKKSDKGSIFETDVEYSQQATQSTQ